jgi:antirestriction protein ArdC
VSTGNIREDHVQYIQGWIKVLKKDNKAISKASGLAARATTAILENYESVSTVRENAEKAA